MMKPKTVLMGLRVYEDDKREFQKICFDLRLKTNGRATEAVVFREMLNWLKKNKEVVEKRLTLPRV